jgi:murein peptide amidase A
VTRTAPGLARELKRLGRNIKGYFGETIDIGSVLADCIAAAQRWGWTVEEIHRAPELLLGFKRLSPETAQARSHDERPSARPRVYISTGIHGDEPAGPLAMRQLLQDNRWPAEMDLWLCPCLNPSGFVTNRRENPEGLDLNRDYRQPKSVQTHAHIAWLERQPFFDLCLCLHEDWESHGFYVYELNPDGRPSLAERVVEAVERVCPIDRSDLIEGRPAHGGIIRPEVDPRDRPEWPEAFYLLTCKTRLSYTFEAPSDFSLEARVRALVNGVESALNQSLETAEESPRPAE